MITPEEVKKLHEAAKKAASNAYSPYSTIHVGAAVLCGDGSIYSGANVENISFGATICAERVALTKAVSEGERNFKALYLYTKAQWQPCGMCLQVMSEFLSSDIPVILGSDKKETVLSMRDLFPQQINKITFEKLKTSK